jgi:Protein kinase domain/Calx-beta domain
MLKAQEMPGDETSFDLTGIKASFDALAAGGCDAEEFSAAMIARCLEKPEIVWEVLGLIDQYGRRGQLAKQDLSALKSQIHAQAFKRSLPEPVNTVARLAFSRENISKPAPAPRQLAEPPKHEHKRYPQTGSVLQRRFVLEQKLGSGGMGTVFKALDRNRLDLPEAERYVALKVLREDLASRPDAVQRLRQEFLQTQRLSHPGIVNVHDLDTDAGTHFFTMELLQGELLSSVIARMSPRCMERSAAEAILCELGSALVYAHDCGIQHADLKPGNIMITQGGDLRVLDFGAATPVRREPWIADAGQSFNGVTRAYASCERLCGEAPQVRDDIFSFGCLAYELLAGTHPFDRRSALQARAENVRPRRIEGLSRRQWRALMKALAWDRADRQDSLAEFVRDLVPAPPGKPLPGPQLLQSRDLARVGNGATVKSVTLLGAIVVMLAVVLLPESTLPPQAAAARQRLIRMGEDATLAVRPTITRVRQWGGGLYSDARDLAAPSPIASTNESPAESTLPAVAAAGGESRPLVVPAAEAADATSEPAVAPIASIVHTPARIEFMTDTLTVPESSPVAKIVVQRRGTVDQGATFTWRTISGTAAENQDYAAFGSVTEAFAPGQATAAILVPIVRDADVEGTETFYVEVTEVVGQARLGSLTRITVYIEDDDSAATGN